MYMYVTGPYNVVRLEGTINSTKKVIYLFFDIHSDPSQQLRCEDPRTLNINTFLVEEFDKLNKENPNKTYDFVFERGPHWSLVHDKNIRGRYISEIGDLFARSFNIDKEINRAQKSDLIPNVRFHYVDVRNFILNVNRYAVPVENNLDDMIFDRRYDSNILNDFFKNIYAMQGETTHFFSLLY